MKITRRLLTFILALCFSLTLVFWKPVSAKTDEQMLKEAYSDFRVRRYEDTLQEYNKALTRKYSSNGLTNILYNGEDIKLAETKLAIYEINLRTERIAGANADPQRIAYLENKIVSEKEKLLHLKEKGEKINNVKEKVKRYGKAANQFLVEVLDIVKDPNHIDYGGATFRIVEKIGVCMLDKYGLGCLLDTYTNFLTGLSGSTTQSDNEALLNDIEDLIDGIHEQLDEVEKEIRNLTKELGKQADEIVSKLTNAIEATSAKERLMEFTSSASGNFSYNRFKNYILGSNSAVENPSGFKEAYVDKLNDYINENRTPEEIKSMWDKIYVSLDVANESRRSNIDVFYYDYLLENKDIYTKSIGIDYYTYLAANRELLGDKSAEIAAIDYINDLYYTAIMADQMLCKCYNYQILSMVLEYGFDIDDNSRYYYGKGEDDYITYKDIMDSYDAIEIREELLEEQVIKDIAYISNMEGSYYRELEDGGIECYSNDNTETFGQLMTNETVYLNELHSSLCYEFGFNKALLNYKWYADGIDVTVDPSFSYFHIADSMDSYESLIAVAYYGDVEIYNITFDLNSTTSFNGGTGTFDDPYLISDAEQFLKIGEEENLDKYFKLIDDISFAGKQYSPIGTEKNPFEGTLDGNGHIIDTVRYNGNNVEYAGLFGYLGQNAIVKNLTITNSYFNASARDAEKVYVGSIAGFSAGLIYNCHASKTFVYMSLDNEPHDKSINKNVYVYAGGIVGFTTSATRSITKFTDSDILSDNFFITLGSYPYASNETGNIFCCTYNEGGISAYSSRDYSGNSDKANQSFVYAGGIAGYATKGTIIANCAVRNVGPEFNISASIKSYANKMLSTSYVYAQSYAGGIAGFAATGSRIFNVYSFYAANSNYDCSNYIKASNDVGNNGAMSFFGIDMSLNKKESKTFSEKYNSGVETTGKLDDYSLSNYKEENSSCYNILYYFDGDADEEICSDYKIGQYIMSFSDPILFNGLVFKVNDMYYYSSDSNFYNQYRLLGYYFIDNLKSLDNSKNNETNVIVLFAIEIGGKEVILSKEVTMLALMPYIKDITIYKYPTVAKFNIYGDPYVFNGKISINYTNGLSTIVDYSNTSDFNPLKNEILFNDNLIENVTFEKVGLNTVVISYNGYTARYNVNIICTHNEHVTEDDIIIDPKITGTVAATCSHDGYDYVYCRDCKKVIEKSNIQPAFGHPEIESFDTHEELLNDLFNKHMVLVDYKEATCHSKGYTGDIYCTMCGCLVQKGEIIPKLPHIFEEYDEHTHKCTDPECGAKEEHHYITIENETSITYKCIDCGYESQPVPKSRSEIESLPKIIVSDGYALGGGNEVVVYVSIINNPGITGASFSITFDHNLKYIDYENGSILENPICIVNDENVDRYMISFTVASDKASYKNGILLKLVFETPEKVNDGSGYKPIEVGDKFEINVTYSNSKKSMLSSPTNKAFDILTFGGSINVVDHLPGDVNNDGIVNLIDAIAIARYLSNYNDDNFYSCFSDLNLDGGTNIDDLTRLLQFIVGGYDAPVQSNTYSIILKKNNGEEDATIEMDYYAKDDEGNYIFDSINNEYVINTMSQLDDLQMDGYRFDGWFTKFVGGNQVNNGDKAYYDADQYKQTLYAHFSQNKVTFVINGETEEYVYDVDNDNYLVDLKMVAESKSKNITIKIYNGNKNPLELLYSMEVTRSITKWQTIDGSVYELGSEPINLKDGKIGNLVLYPVWSEVKAPERDSVIWNEVDSKISDGSVRLDGWTLSPNSGILFNDIITSDINLFAFISNYEYTLTYVNKYDNVEETYTESSKRKTGMEAATNLLDLSSTFVRYGYTLDGWVDENNVKYGLEDLLVNSVPNDVLYAVWKEIKYDVKYYGPNGALVKKESIKYGQYASSAAYDLSGYKFIDWYTSTSYQSLFNFNNPISGETNIYGKYATKKTGNYSTGLSAGTYKVTCTGDLVGKIDITARFYISQTSAPQQSSFFTLSNGDTFTIYYNSSIEYSYYYFGTSSNISITEMPKSTSGKFGTYSAGTYKVSCTGNVSGTIKITLDYNIPGGGVHRTEDIYVSNNGRFTIPYDSTYCTYSYSYTGSAGSISISKV